MLQVGFSQIDITPPLGVKIAGYFEERIADCVHDPLYATAVVFDDGVSRAVVMSLDLLGIPQAFMGPLRTKIADAAGTVPAGVYLACTHTHTGPGVMDGNGAFLNEEYAAWLSDRLRDAAVSAAEDRAPARLFQARGTAGDVAFCRRFRMKDGTVRTNPGFQNPDILHALGTADPEVSLLIIKREGKEEIGIVNFGVHPDVIGGCGITADYIRYVRDTYEAHVPNARCMFLNGAQGDLNHIDVRLDPERDAVYHFPRAKYMGGKIARAAADAYNAATPIEGDRVSFGQKSVFVRYNKGTEEELMWAKPLVEVYETEGLDAATPEYEGMQKIEVTAKARRIVNLSSLPDEKELILSAVKVGGAVFAGIPGEPFCEVGRRLKRESGASLTIPTCCTNGYEGYYPTESAFSEGGYEVLTARYVAGTAERITDESLSLIESL